MGDANRNDITLFEPTIAAAGGLLAGVETLHLDRGYDYNPVQACAAVYGIDDVGCAKRRKPGNAAAKTAVPPGLRWTVERTNSWQAHSREGKPLHNQRAFHIGSRGRFPHRGTSRTSQHLTGTAVDRKYGRLKHDTEQYPDNETPQPERPACPRSHQRQRRQTSHRPETNPSRDNPTNRNHPEQAQTPTRRA